jgi:hypothetical protein
MCRPRLERNTLRLYWRNRADTTVEHWDLNLAVVVDGVAVGARSKPTHSRTGAARRPAHGWDAATTPGIGREVRHAALHLIFAGFDADQATIRAWQDNTAPLRVTSSLPYLQTGSSLQQRRDAPTPCWNSP